MLRPLLLLVPQHAAVVADEAAVAIAAATAAADTANAAAAVITATVALAAAFVLFRANYVSETSSINCDCDSCCVCDVMVKSFFLPLSVGLAA